MNSTSITLAVILLNLSGCERQPEPAIASAPNAYTKISREITTPSGDWMGWIDYTYDVNGSLRHATYDFRTLSGYDEDTEDFSPTKCLSEFSVSKDGDLILVSKTITDLSSGEQVERTFYEPEFTHWMTLAQARQEAKAEASRQ